MAYGYTRGLPLVAMIEGMLPTVIGSSTRMRGLTVRSLTASAPSTITTLTRAASLIDLAVWDLAGQQSGLSLGQLLGASRAEVPVMAVAGYFRDRRGDEEVLSELAGLQDAGYSLIKLMLGSLSEPGTMGFLREARRVLRADVRIAVDAHYSLRTVDEAKDAASRLADVGVWMLEDPFLPTRWRQIAEVARSSRLLVGAGEDVDAPEQYQDIVESATLLRVDPTTSGGVRAAVTGIELAAVKGTPVIPHVFTTLSGQLASAFGAIAAVEHIPSATGADPIDAFLQRPALIDGGVLRIDEAPGTGMALHWDEMAARSDHLIVVTEKRTR